MNYDVVIVGSGIVGATAALALAKNSSLKIALLDAKTSPAHERKTEYDFRVSALSSASKNILENLSAWNLIEKKRVSSYQKMSVWNTPGHGEISFDCEHINQPALGYIVEDSVTRASLLEEISRCPTIDVISPIKLISLNETEKNIELTAENQITLSAKLVIGADGAHSWIREKAGIELKTRSYQHTAIVATVESELPHETTARQRFLPQGPLAFLPLDRPNFSSIVWSTSPSEAEELLSLSDIDFCKRLSDAFDYRLGNITHTDSRHAFPLVMRHAKNYVRPRIALIGDAAHTVHPLAGQGVNLGLLDAASLAEVIHAAHKKNRDIGSFATLRRYERWRKSDTIAMLTMVEGLKQLFASEKRLIQTIRDTGINFSNQFLLIKNFFANYAVGKRGDLPVLARS